MKTTEFSTIHKIILHSTKTPTKIKHIHIYSLHRRNEEWVSLNIPNISIPTETTFLSFI